MAPLKLQIFRTAGLQAGSSWNSYLNFIYLSFFSFTFTILQFYVYERFACGYGDAPFVFLVPMEARKQGLDLELQVYVSHPVGARNQTWVLGKNSTDLSC